MDVNILRFNSTVCFSLFSAQKETMNKIIRKGYKKLIKNKSLDELDIYFLLKKLDDNFKMSSYLKLIK